MWLLFLPLIAGVLLLLVGGRLIQWYVTASPAALVRGMRTTAAVIVILVAIPLAIGGALVPAGLLAGVAMWLMGMRGGRHSMGRARRTAGQRSTVRTARLEASLAHDTGDMDVEVLAGMHTGERFSQMDEETVIAVWRDCAGDEESRSIVEAYLDRRAPQWRQDVEDDGDFGGPGAGGPGSGDGTGQSSRGGSGIMTEQEAYDILGLERGASEAEIRAAHRRLMKQMHPDQGGSTFFAARLNEAKDLLLGRK
ncbi:MAG: DnaJ domain-containing protein [Devosia sp.]